MNADRAAISRGEVVGGHYRLERILAEGGMGIVWAARDLRLGRSVAIKFLGANALSNPVQRERFAREAQLASKIRSPHVVQIIGDGMTDSGVPFVVMELLDGECLAAFLAREGRCSLATCGSIVEQVCRALSSAHSLGLVHRDIKPANIFLTPLPGGEVFVRLLDFGIAKELHFGPSGLTRAGELLGSTDYMSPEQFRKPDAVSAATDIWSLGVVVYEMLTGKLPFDESSFPSLAVRVAPGTFPPPSAVFPGLPAAIDGVVLHALAIHPSQRYASVDEFGAEFLRVVRAHISLSVVRADIVRVFDDSASQDYEELEELSSIGQPTLQVRGWAPFWGVVLVALCGMVLIGSFLVLERSERGGSAAEARVEKAHQQLMAAAPQVEQAPQAAAGLPLVAAHEPAALPLPAAAESDLDPLPSAEGAAKPLDLKAQLGASEHKEAPAPGSSANTNAAAAPATNPSAPTRPTTAITAPALAATTPSKNTAPAPATNANRPIASGTNASATNASATNGVRSSASRTPAPSLSGNVPSTNASRSSASGTITPAPAANTPSTNAARSSASGTITPAPAANTPSTNAAGLAADSKRPTASSTASAANAARSTAPGTSAPALAANVQLTNAARSSASGTVTPAPAANALATHASANASATHASANAPATPASATHASANASATHASATKAAASAAGLRAPESPGVAPDARARAVSEAGGPAHAGEASARRKRADVGGEKAVFSLQPMAAPGSDAESKYGF